MNSLSWLLLLTDIFSNISALSVIFSILGVILLFGLCAYYDCVYDRAYPHIKSFLVGLSVVISISILVPSKNTMYMIAASEVGEKALKTPEAKELYDLLHNKLKETLSPEKK